MAGLSVGTCFSGRNKGKQVKTHMALHSPFFSGKQWLSQNPYPVISPYVSLARTGSRGLPNFKGIWEP